MSFPSHIAHLRSIIYTQSFYLCHGASSEPSYSELSLLILLMMIIFLIKPIIFYVSLEAMKVFVDALCKVINYSSDFADIFSKFINSCIL